MSFWDTILAGAAAGIVAGLTIPVVSLLARRLLFSWFVVQWTRFRFGFVPIFFSRRHHFMPPSGRIRWIKLLAMKIRFTRIYDRKIYDLKAVRLGHIDYRRRPVYISWRTAGKVGPGVVDITQNCDGVPGDYSYRRAKDEDVYHTIIPLADMSVGYLLLENVTTRRLVITVFASGESLPHQVVYLPYEEFGSKVDDLAERANEQQY